LSEKASQPVSYKSDDIAEEEVFSGPPRGVASIYRASSLLLPVSDIALTFTFQAQRLSGLSAFFGETNCYSEPWHGEQ
jgi:hypothetical protein